MEQLGFLLNTWGERNSPQEATEVGVGRLVNSDDPTVAVVAEAIQQAILELNKNNAIRDN